MSAILYFKINKGWAKDNHYPRIKIEIDTKKLLALYELLSAYAANSCFCSV